MPSLRAFFMLFMKDIIASGNMCWCDAFVLVVCVKPCHILLLVGCHFIAAGVSPGTSLIAVNAGE
jgi:hypothetical protein